MNSVENQKKPVLTRVQKPMSKPVFLCLVAFDHLIPRFVSRTLRGTLLCHSATSVAIGRIYALCAGDAT